MAAAITARNALTSASAEEGANPGASTDEPPSTGALACGHATEAAQGDSMRAAQAAAKQAWQATTKRASPPAANRKEPRRVRRVEWWRGGEEGASAAPDEEAAQQSEASCCTVTTSFYSLRDGAWHDAESAPPSRDTSTTSTCLSMHGVGPGSA